MKISKEKILLWGLVVLFAVLMTIPFIIPHCGFFALIGFIPLLMLERVASMSGVKRVWVYHYSAFVLWNALTTFWVCNATVGGGLFAIFANALQMSVIFGIFRFSKKYFSGVLPYIFLAVTWITWERAYFDAEISWPWLVLGNAFAGSIRSIQWYEFTGSLGGSLWIWGSNLALFGMMVTLSDGRWNGWNIKAKSAAGIGIGLLVTAPFIISFVIFRGYRETESEKLEFVAVQPNIDPYHKFQALSQQQQNAILEDMAERAMRDRKGVDSLAPLVLLAPETFTNDVIVNDINLSRTYRRFVTFLKDYPGVNMLFGASSYEYFDGEKPSHTARKVRDGRWVESHNSALMIDGSGRNEIFHKSRLVVAVEKTPYPAVFCKIDDWLGGVMGRNIGQDSISVLNCVDPRDGSEVPVGCAVCYESVYGEYFTGYVREGARVMTVITNDAWWGDTPGYRQHLRYASLRAIETRRSIARCANTGISALIDQRGVIHEPSAWWEPAVVRGSLNLNDELTFFVRHGDVVGRLCTLLFWLLVAALAVRLFMRR